MDLVRELKLPDSLHNSGEDANCRPLPLCPSSPLSITRTSSWAASSERTDYWAEPIFLHLRHQDFTSAIIDRELSRDFQELLVIDHLKHIAPSITKPLSFRGKRHRAGVTQEARTAQETLHAYGKPISRRDQSVFYGFPDLPIELRLRIWFFALPRQRVVELVFKATGSGESCDWKVSSPARIPAMLHASFESRQEALRYYQLMFSIKSSAQQSGNTYFDPSVDMLHLGCRSYPIRSCETIFQTLIWVNDICKARSVSLCSAVAKVFRRHGFHENDEGERVPLPHLFDTFDSVQSLFCVTHPWSDPGTAKDLRMVKSRRNSDHTISAKRLRDLGNAMKAEATFGSLLSPISMHMGHSAGCDSLRHFDDLDSDSDDENGEDDDSTPNSDAELGYDWSSDDGSDDILSDCGGLE